MSKVVTIKQIVAPYLKKFKGTEGYFIEDDKAMNFFHRHPLNSDPTDVLLKVEEVGHVLDMDKRLQDRLAKHIVAAKLDEGLEQSSKQVVDKIVEFQEDDISIYMFATRYCNYHKPDIYPIYDSTLEQTLVWFYSTAAPASFDPRQLLNYASLHGIVDQFARVVGLSELNYWELDKFLWVYGRRMKEAL